MDILDAFAKDSVMGKYHISTDVLTAEQLRRLADVKLAEAAAIADKEERRSALAEAENLKVKAKLKGWLASELRPPT
jgi:hypothetical protein